MWTSPRSLSRNWRLFGNTRASEVAAASIIGVVPAFLLAVFFQRYLVKGLAMGGLKG
jgi:ABC-type maltose transport system permease subunit